MESVKEVSNALQPLHQDVIRNVLVLLLDWETAHSLRQASKQWSWLVRCSLADVELRALQQVLSDAPFAHGAVGVAVLGSFGSADLLQRHIGINTLRAAFGHFTATFPEYASALCVLQEKYLSRRVLRFLSGAHFRTRDFPEHDLKNLLLRNTQTYMDPVAVYLTMAILDFYSQAMYHKSLGCLGLGCLQHHERWLGGPPQERIIQSALSEMDHTYDHQSVTQIVGRRLALLHPILHFPLALKLLVSCRQLFEEKRLQPKVFSKLYFIANYLGGLYVTDVDGFCEAHLLPAAYYQKIKQRQGVDRLHNATQAALTRWRQQYGVNVDATPSTWDQLKQFLSLPEPQTNWSLGPHQ